MELDKETYRAEVKKLKPDFSDEEFDNLWPLFLEQRSKPEYDPQVLIAAAMRVGYDADGVVAQIVQLTTPP